MRKPQLSFLPTNTCRQIQNSEHFFRPKDSFIGYFDFKTEIVLEFRTFILVSMSVFLGVYPGVIMTLLFRRKISYHLLQTYLPSGLFVIVAWLSLFLPPESIPGRVTMAMTTLLTLAAMFGAVR